VSLELKRPRPGKTPYWSVRGTYLGIYVDRSTRTPERRKAAKVLAKWKKEIECGEFSRPGDPTFLSAAVAYIKGGGERRYLELIIEHFGETLLPKIDQAAIDTGAVKLYPDVSPATRNRQFYTPVAAVLHHAGISIDVNRPKGADGSKRTDWLWPEQAFRFFRAAGEVDEELRIFLVVLCYCGPRLSEALSIGCNDVRLDESFAYIGKTKNGDPRAVHLPPEVIAALANHPRGLDRKGERLFRFRKNGRLYNLMRKTKALAADLSWVTFHVFCHTYGTWMRRYAGLDTRGLVGTGRWADEDSVRRYVHVVASEESRRADMLPVEKSWKRGAPNHDK